MPRMNLFFPFLYAPLSKATARPKGTAYPPQPRAPSSSDVVSARSHRKAENLRVLTGESTFRDSFRGMLDSVQVPFEECKQILRDSA